MEGPLRRVPLYEAPKAEAPPPVEGIITARITETAVIATEESDPNSPKEVYYVLIVSVLYVAVSCEGLPESAVKISSLCEGCAVMRIFTRPCSILVCPCRNFPSRYCR